MRAVPILLLVCAVTKADTPEKEGRDYFVGWLYYGNTERLLSGFEVVYCTDLANSPKYTREVCSLAVEKVSDLSRRDEDKCRKLADQFVWLAKRARNNSDENEDALWALAEAKLFRVRMLRLLKDEETGPDQILEVADGFLDLSSRTTEAADAFMRGVDLYFEAARDKEAKRLEILEKIGALQTRAGQQGLSAAVHDAIGVSLTLEKAWDAYRAEDLKQTKALLESCIATLKPHLKGKDPDRNLAMKHNEVVSLALREKKLGLKLRYRPEEFRTGGEIRFHLPLSRLWSYARSSRKDKLGTIWQRAPDGTVLRSMGLHRYDPNVTYTLGDKGFSGDNIKGLAMIGVRDVKSVIIDIKRERKLSKGKLGRGIRSCQRFEIGGLTEKGD
jgi:hypothetical protein